MIGGQCDAITFNCSAPHPHPHTSTPCSLINYVNWSFVWCTGTSEIGGASSFLRSGPSINVVFCRWKVWVFFTNIQHRVPHLIATIDALNTKLFIRCAGRNIQYAYQWAINTFICIPEMQVPLENPKCYFVVMSIFFIDVLDTWSKRPYKGRQPQRKFIILKTQKTHYC